MGDEQPATVEGSADREELEGEALAEMETDFETAEASADSVAKETEEVRVPPVADVTEKLAEPAGVIPEFGEAAEDRVAFVEEISEPDPQSHPGGRLRGQQRLGPPVSRATAR